MRLYLSSYRLGNQASDFLSEIAINARVAVIQNAQDCWTDAERRQQGLDREFEALRSIGLEPEELDLRHYFSKANFLDKVLSNFGYVWVMGGNTFVLRQAFALSGFDEILSKGCHLIYGGYSAGACVMGPSLKGLEIVDDPSSMPYPEQKSVIWDALKLYPYYIAPHYRSDHPESPMVEKLVEHYIESKLPFVALRDGEAVVFETSDA